MMDRPGATDPDRPDSATVTDEMLETDANLERAKEFEGYKVLPPCVIYGKIGQGGMGAVYRGRHLNLDIDVAVKCLKPDLTGEDDQFVVRFRREARSAARINHQNVVRVYDVSEERGLHYIVMELVSGETARQRVVRKGTLSVGEALQILHGAAAGLAEAHGKGFIHRDIKPDNIMIASNGAVKVADLGLAKPSGMSQMSMLSGTNMVMGTPQYMPPEQWENTATVTPAADIWALGATLYYLLIGGEAIAKDSLPRIMQRIVMQPFPDVRQKRPDVPDDVAALLAKATAKEPEDRYADGRELAEAIDALATRRDSLRDVGTAAAPDHATLVSPPPAKTLAKIKFWLDEQASGAAAGPGGTVAVPPPGVAAGGTASPARAGGIGRAPWIAGGALLVLLLALFWWQPWAGSGDPLADVDRLAGEGRYAEAVAAARAVFRAQPSLVGERDKLADLHFDWAERLLGADDVVACLGQVDRGSEYRADEPRARPLRERALRRAAELVDERLVRAAPDGVPVASGAPVTFRGRSESPLAVALRIDGQPVPLAEGGAFEVALDVGAKQQVPVEARLTTGDAVALTDWPVRYRIAAGSGEPGEPNTTDIGREPNRGDNGTRPAPMVAGEITVTPSRLELRGDQPGKLTVDAPRGAEIVVDGVVVQRPQDTERYEHVVDPAAAQPAPIVVVVRRPGEPDQRFEVPVARVPVPLVFAGGLTFEGDRIERGGRFATGQPSVVVTGRMPTRADRFRVGVREVADARWQGDRFRLTVPLQSGANQLQVVAERRFHEPVEQRLTIERVERPRLALPPGGDRRATVAAASYEVVVDADRWTDRVRATSGRQVVDLVRTAGKDRFRGRVALQQGRNAITVEARNAFGQQARLRLDIRRQGGEAALPAATGGLQIRAVRVLRADGPAPVASNEQVFLAAKVPFEVEGSPASKVLVRSGDVQRELARDAAGRVSIDEFLVEVTREMRATPIEIVLDDGKRRSAPFRFFVWYDTQPPQVTVDAVAPVGKGEPIALRGKWVDPGGLRRDGAMIGELDVQVTPRGVARSGNWSLEHPGLQQSTTLELRVVDRSGNVVVVPVAVTVR